MIEAVVPTEITFLVIIRCVRIRHVLGSEATRKAGKHVKLDYHTGGADQIARGLTVESSKDRTDLTLPPMISIKDAAGMTPV